MPVTAGLPDSAPSPKRLHALGRAAAVGAAFAAVAAGTLAVALPVTDHERPTDSSSAAVAIETRYGDVEGNKAASMRRRSFAAVQAPATSEYSDIASNKARAMRAITSE